MSDRKQQLLDLLKDKKEMDEDTSDIEAELFQMDQMEEDMGRSDGSSKEGEKVKIDSMFGNPMEEIDKLKEKAKELREKQEETKTKRSMGSPITGEKLKTVGGGISRGGGIAVKGIKFKGVF